MRATQLLTKGSVVVILLLININNITMQLIRTSFAFPAPLYHRLEMISKEKNLSLSKTVQFLLEPAIINEEEQELRRIYNAFKSVKGAYKGTARDSQSIDELLYAGKNDGKKRGRT